MDIENHSAQKNKENEMIDENEGKKKLDQMETEQQQPIVQQPPEDNQEKQKRVLIETFKQLHERLSKGCGREKCKFETCLAHPINKNLMNDPKQAQQKAVDILKKKLAKIEMCSIPQKNVKSLQRQELESLLSPQQIEQNFKEVLGRIEEVFSDFDAINNSFFADQNPYQLVEEHNGMIDFNSILLLYNTLYKVNDDEKKKWVDDMFSASFVKF